MSSAAKTTWRCEDFRGGSCATGSAPTVHDAKVAAHAAWRGMGRASLAGIGLTVTQRLASGKAALYAARQARAGDTIRWERLDG